jgi:hypothetical protein
MPIATAEPEVKAPTKQEIEDLKQEIRDLLAHYQTRRLQLGCALIKLQGMLAHHGKGTFTTVATVELKIPHSTVYDTIDYAKAEAKRIKGLSGKRTKSADDIDVDWDDPEEVQELIRLFQIDIDRDGGKTGVKNPKPKDYQKMIQIKFILPAKSRQRIARSWQIVKTDEAEHKKLTWRIAKEILHAAIRVKKSSGQ